MATYRNVKLTPLEDAALEILVKTKVPNPEKYKLNEDVHPMGVHVKETSKKVEGLPAFKVTKIGAKVKEHGGLKVGEHIHDNHLDDLSDMGHKIKMEEVEPTNVEEASKKNSRTFKLRGQYSTGEPNPISTNGAFVSGPQDQIQKKANEEIQSTNEDMHDADESLPKDAKKKIMNGKSKYKGLDKANGDDDKDAVETTSEEVEPDFTVIEHKAFSFDLPNQLLFADYLNAAQMFTESYDDAVKIADSFFQSKDESLGIETFLPAF